MVEYWKTFRKFLKKLCFTEDCMALEKFLNLCKPWFNREAKNIYLIVWVQGFKERIQSRKVNITKTLAYLKEKKNRNSLRTDKVLELLRM